MTRRHGWSKNILVHQIENQTYEKTLLNQNNFEETLPAMISNEARLALKDEYTFDFLELGAVKLPKRGISPGHGWIICVYGESVQA